MSGVIQEAGSALRQPVDLAPTVARPDSNQASRCNYSSIYLSGDVIAEGQLKFPKGRANGTLALSCRVFSSHSRRRSSKRSSSFASGRVRCIRSYLSVTLRCGRHVTRDPCPICGCNIFYLTRLVVERTRTYVRRRPRGVPAGKVRRSLRYRASTRQISDPPELTRSALAYRSVVLIPRGPTCTGKVERSEVSGSLDAAEFNCKPYNLPSRSSTKEHLLVLTSKTPLCNNECRPSGAELSNENIFPRTRLRERSCQRIIVI